MRRNIARRWASSTAAASSPRGARRRSRLRRCAVGCWRCWPIPGWGRWGRCGGSPRRGGRTACRCGGSRSAALRWRTSSSRWWNPSGKPPGQTREPAVRRRLAAIIIKEFVQLVRDPRTLALALLMPVIQLLLFGYAITTEVEHLPTVIFDQSQSQESRALIQRFVNSRFFDVTARAANLRDVQSQIDGGRARVGIVIPPDFAASLQAGGPGRGEGLGD